MHDLTKIINGLQWRFIEEKLNNAGIAMLPNLLDSSIRHELIGLYEQEKLFRSRVVMARHNFGKGEYKYFSYPLPKIVAELRYCLYPKLAILANKWMKQLCIDQFYPDSLEEFTERCHAAGQLKPTPLMLRYRKGDYNCLHQDLYGECLFPLQVVFLLNEPGVDFEGGELVLVEQRPRMQSRPTVVPLRAGDAAIFAVNIRPQAGTRGYYRVNMRHGVSEVRKGERHTLGIIFHDAL